MVLALAARLVFMEPPLMRGRVYEPQVAAQAPTLYMLFQATTGVHMFRALQSGTMPILVAMWAYLSMGAALAAPWP